YRLLSFALLWGCLLGALALAASFGGRMRGEHAAACLLLLGLFAGPYLPAHHSTDQVSVAGEGADPAMGRGGGNQGFRPSPAPLAASAFPTRYGLNFAVWDYGLVDEHGKLRHGGEGRLPAPRPGDSLVLEGVVPGVYQGPLQLAVSVDGRPQGPVSLPPGAFRLALPMTEDLSGDWVGVQLHGDGALDA